MLKILILLSLSLPSFLLSKTIVFTTAFNRPDFIELQHKLFSKFLEDDYEFWVVNDANTLPMQKRIQKKCKSLGIKCIDVPQSIHKKPYLPREKNDDYNRPNVRHCNAVQWAWDNYFSLFDDFVMLIDSDMFLIRPFSVEKLMKDKHITGVFWGTEDSETLKPYSYIWLGLILFNNLILPERHTIQFNCGRLPGTNAICDSGGWTSLYLDKFRGKINAPSLDILQGHQFYCPYRYTSAAAQDFRYITQEQIVQNLRDRNFSEDEIEMVLQKPYTIELIENNTFLHYRAGTNYEGYSGEFLSKKDMILNAFFNKLLSK